MKFDKLKLYDGLKTKEQIKLLEYLSNESISVNTRWDRYYENQQYLPKLFARDPIQLDIHEKMFNLIKLIRPSFTKEITSGKDLHTIYPERLYIDLRYFIDNTNLSIPRQNQYRNELMLLGYGYYYL